MFSWKLSLAYPTVYLHQPVVYPSSALLSRKSPCSTPTDSTANSRFPVRHSASFLLLFLLDLGIWLRVRPAIEPETASRTSTRRPKSGYPCLSRTPTNKRSTANRRHASQFSIKLHQTAHPFANIECNPRPRTETDRVRAFVGVRAPLATCIDRVQPARHFVRLVRRCRQPPRPACESPCPSPPIRCCRRRRRRR